MHQEKRSPKSIKSGNRKCLDLLITYKISKVKEVNCEENYKATPYTVVLDEEGKERGVRFTRAYWQR